MLAVLIALAGQSITPVELTDVTKVAAICRASDKVADRSGDRMDAINYMRASADSGGLSLEQRSLLIRMCGVYFAGVADLAQEELDKAVRKLDENSDELRRLLRNETTRPSYQPQK